MLSLVCCLLWGSAFPCIKIGYSLFSIQSGNTSSQMLFAGLRFTLAGIIAICIASVGAKRVLTPKKSSWGMVFKLCLAQTVVQYFFFYVGLAGTSSVKASIIKGTGTFISILLACFVFKQERFTLAKLCGCILGFGGILIINLPAGGVGGGFSLTGEGFILLANVAGAVSTSLIKNYSQKDNPVVLSGWQFFCGGIILTAAALLMGGTIPHFTIGGALMIVYLACVSACAYSLWGMLLKNNPLSKIAVYGFMTPVFGVLLSALLTAEGKSTLGIRHIIALAFVCAGIYIVNKFKEKRNVR